MKSARPLGAPYFTPVKPSVSSPRTHPASAP